jgi:CO/xanthine dehydrogenase FAD-binding subunit
MNTTNGKNPIKVADRPLDGSEQCLIIDPWSTLQEILTAPSLPELLKHSLQGRTTWQQRNGIALRQALLSPTLAPQWIAALLAWGAHISSSNNDKENTLLADYLRGVGSTRNQPAQLLVPIKPPERRWGEAFVSRTPSDRPIVTAIAVVDMDKDVIRLARLAMTGVWRETARLSKAPAQLTGKPLIEKNILQVVEEIGQEVEPSHAWHGGADYRRSMATLMASRAFMQCLAGEKGQ